MAELRFLHRASFEETVAAVSQFASSRRISRAMVAYKLLRVNIISSARWRELDKHYEDEWIAAQARAVNTDKSGGPTYYVLKRHRLGHALLDLVKNSLAEGFLTHTKAGQVLGVKPRNVDPLVYLAGMRGGQ
jgi:Zn-dependent peptidase ImmA (M78 family)